MRRVVSGLAVLLMAQAAAQDAAPDRARRAGARDTAAQSRPAESKPGPVKARVQDEPVTPATDYIPYDRRTGGM
jgi:hypothetical protein